MLERHHGQVKWAKVRGSQVLIRGEDGSHIHVFDVRNADVANEIVESLP